MCKTIIFSNKTTLKRVSIDLKNSYIKRFLRNFLILNVFLEEVFIAKSFKIKIYLFNEIHNKNNDIKFKGRNNIDDLSYKLNRFFQ